jgi:hypothetical protein
MIIQMIWVFGIVLYEKTHHSLQTMAFFHGVERSLLWDVQVNFFAIGANVFR